MDEQSWMNSLAPRGACDTFLLPFLHFIARVPRGLRGLAVPHLAPRANTLTGGRRRGRRGLHRVERAVRHVLHLASGLA